MNPYCDLKKKFEKSSKHTLSNTQTGISISQKTRPKNFSIGNTKMALYYIEKKGSSVSLAPAEASPKKLLKLSIGQIQTNRNDLNSPDSFKKMPAKESFIEFQPWMKKKSQSFFSPQKSRIRSSENIIHSIRTFKRPSKNTDKKRLKIFQRKKLFSPKNESSFLSNESIKKNMSLVTQGAFFNKNLFIKKKFDSNKKFSKKKPDSEKIVKKKTLCKKFLKNSSASILNHQSTNPIWPKNFKSQIANITLLKEARSKSVEALVTKPKTGQSPTNLYHHFNKPFFFGSVKRLIHKLEDENRVKSKDMDGIKRQTLEKQHLEILNEENPILKLKILKKRQLILKKLTKNRYKKAKNGKIQIWSFKERRRSNFLLENSKKKHYTKYKRSKEKIDKNI